MKFLNALDKRRWPIMGLESDQLTGSSRIRPHFNWNLKRGGGGGGDGGFWGG